MSDHEFYADPTVFDLWQDRTGGWFSVRVARLRPYLWSVAFSALAVLLLGIALSVLGFSVYQRVQSGAGPGWNQSLAQWLTVLMALLACHGLLEQSLTAWPGASVPSAHSVTEVACGPWAVPPPWIGW